MKRLSYTSWFLLAILVIIFSMNMRVSATSWIDLNADEVIEKAKVVVIGKYDLSERKPTKSTIYTEIYFNVKGIYKGEATKTLIVGIDDYNQGSVKDFQDKGGEFLLFLEEDLEEGYYLVPVAGPNGMVQVLEGKIVGETNKNRKRYEVMLKEQSTAPLERYQDHSNKSKQIYLIIMISSIILVISIFIAILFWHRKRL